MHHALSLQTQETSVMNGEIKIGCMEMVFIEYIQNIEYTKTINSLTFSPS